MSSNLALANTALSSIGLVAEAVSGGVSTKADGVKVTLKDRGNLKVYFKGANGPALAKALTAKVAATPELSELKPFPLTAGTIKFGGATVALYPAFILAVRAVVAANGKAKAPAPVAAIAPPATDKAPAKVPAIAARKKA